MMLRPLFWRCKKMQWLKYNSKCILIFLLFIISPSSFAEKFSSSECLQAKYSTQILHRGRFFGLVENKLSIKKDVCNIEVVFKGILETKWMLDVCREPIHIKVTSKGSQDVYKRNEKCAEKIKTDFCYYRNELLNSLQDHGLIYAEGQREDIKQSHGQIYCSYLLVKRYLDDGIVFSTFESPKNIYEDQTACAIPSLEKTDDSSDSSESSDKAGPEQSSQEISSDISNGKLRPLSESEAQKLNTKEEKPKF